MLRVSGENLVLIFFGVLAVGTCIYVVKDECPPNEEYLLCGPACPANCTDLTGPEVCADECLEGCFCIAGLVRDKNGTCVSLDQCGTPPPKCPKDEEYTCGSSCPATCAQPLPGPCIAPCKFGCYCKTGFVRDESSGKCVAIDDCPIEVCLNENEVYDTCSGGCEPSCLDPEPICNKICMGGCVCSPGLLRDDTGECVSVDKCVKNGTDLTLLAKYLNAINKILHL